jgi:hypothetical protein
MLVGQIPVAHQRPTAIIGELVAYCPLPISRNPRQAIWAAGQMMPTGQDSQAFQPGERAGGLSDRRSALAPGESRTWAPRRDGVNTRRIIFVTCLASAFEGAPGPPPFSSMKGRRTWRAVHELRLRSSPSLLLCHPKPETARLVILDELNSSLFKRCLDPH